MYEPREDGASAAREHGVRERALGVQRNALILLSRQGTAELGAGEDVDHRFMEVAAAALGVARASIWLLERDGKELRCLDLYDTVRREHSSGIVLQYDAAPRYFDALPAMDVIAAHDARTDPRTSELWEGYMELLGITSMLDAPIRAGGRTVGVLCSEHVGTARHFRPDEETFAVAAANLISLHLVEVQRRVADADARLRLAAVEAAAHPIVITDLAGVIVWANPAFTEVTGYTWQESVGRKPGSLLRSGEHDVHFYANLWRTILSGQVWRGLVRNRRKNGEVYTEEMSITPVRASGAAITHFVAVKVDLTERQQLEERLLQSQKLETVGRLAGGIAHDFNNLLAVINGTADLALSNLAEDDPMGVDLGVILDATERAALLTRQLLAFSKKQIVAPEPLDLEAVVKQLLPMLTRLIGEHLTVRLAGGADPGIVSADRSQLNQVIMNLVVNSRDAMKDGGVITITTGNCSLDGRVANPGAGIEEAPFVLLAVADTGLGMTEAVRSHIFEPYFTTKGLQGSGLGLPTVYGIVQQSGGIIEVDSEVGAGTTVRILLPRVALASEPAPEPDPRGVTTGAGRILVVEDEDSLRRLVARILRSAGYDVTEAANGNEALALLEGARASMDLLITDVIMPGMGGVKLAEQVHRRWPDMKVLFTSGYSSDEDFRLEAQKHGRHFLAKPYTVRELTVRVRDLMSAAS